MDSNRDSDSDPRLSASFPTTRWTVVEQIHSADAATSGNALEELCSRYHYPLYCYLRRKNLSHHDAEDALHDFLFKLLRLGAFADLTEGRGRLRGFLSVALSRFLVNWIEAHPHWQREVAQGRFAFPPDAEERYANEEFLDTDTPDRVFDRKWAQTLLATALERLERRCVARGKLREYAVLRPVLLNGGSMRGFDVEAMASELGVSIGTLRVAANRMVADFGAEVEDELRRTAGGRKAIKSELDDLMSAFRES